MGFDCLTDFWGFGGFGFLHTFGSGYFSGLITFQSFNLLVCDLVCVFRVLILMFAICCFAVQLLADWFCDNLVLLFAGVGTIPVFDIPGVDLD